MGLSFSAKSRKILKFIRLTLNVRHFTNRYTIATRVLTQRCLVKLNL